MIRVVIADDQDLIRGGLRAILELEPDIVVVGEAADGASAAREAAASGADLVLMDVQMPGTDGIEGVRLVREARPAARVLMLTMFDLDEYVFGALKAGASGFLLKTTPPRELAEAIRACHGGELLFAPSVTRRLVEAYVKEAPAAGRCAARARGSHRTGAGGVRGACAWAVQCRDRRGAVHGRGDREDPRDAHSGEARTARSGASRRARLRVRAGALARRFTSNHKW